MMRLVKKLIRAIWMSCLVMCLLCLCGGNLQAGFFQRIKDRRQQKTSIGSTSCTSTTTNTFTGTSTSILHNNTAQTIQGITPTTISNFFQEGTTGISCSNGSCNSGSTNKFRLFQRR